MKLFRSIAIAGVIITVVSLGFPRLAEANADPVFRAQIKPAPCSVSVVDATARQLSGLDLRWELVRDDKGEYRRAVLGTRGTKLYVQNPGAASAWRLSLDSGTDGLRVNPETAKLASATSTVGCSDKGRLALGDAETSGDRNVSVDIFQAGQQTPRYLYCYVSGVELHTVATVAPTALTLSVTVL